MDYDVGYVWVTIDAPRVLSTPLPSLTISTDQEPLRVPPLTATSTASRLVFLEAQLSITRNIMAFKRVVRSVGEAGGVEREWREIVRDMAISAQRIMEMGWNVGGREVAQKVSFSDLDTPTSSDR